MIALFIKYLQYEKNYSSHTVLSYNNDLNEFADFVKEIVGDFNPLKIDHKIIRQWIVALMEAGMSPRSVNRKISTLKSFYKFLIKRNYLSYNPVKKINSLKTEKNLPLFFKESEVEKALTETEQSDDDKSTEFELCRNHLIIAMFYETGFRLSELIEIKDTDVDLSNKSIRVLGKRNKERVVPFGNKLYSDIIKYKEIRNKEQNQTVTHFFTRKNGEKMYSRLVYQIVHNAMSEQSSLTKRSPHVLRHTFATAILNGGADINAVKEILGHASLAATQVYTHTTFEQLRNIYKQAHPRA
jgi:integrase/recombinase XerC